MNYRLALPALALPAILFSACSSRLAKCTLPEDNPQHHYIRGMEALEMREFDVAREKFDRLLYCEDDSSKGYGGLSIVAAEKSKLQSDAAFKNVETGKAYDNLNKADKFANNDEDKFDQAVASIRVQTLIKDKDWLDKAVDAHKYGSRLDPEEKKLVYYKGKEALNYFLGFAYYEGYEFEKAKERFALVLNTKADGKWNESADRAWRKTDRIIRAMAGITVGDAGKKIALKQSLSRTDITYLLINELKVEQLFAGRSSASAKQEAMKDVFVPADIVNSPFRQEILSVIRLKLRGLEPRFDQTTMANLFKPADLVTRGEMALLLEDILIRVTGDEKIATAYLGHDKSPYPDIRTTSPYYNAVMNMTTRGIMDSGDWTGDFRLNDPVEGSEALIAIRMMRQKLNKY